MKKKFRSILALMLSLLLLSGMTVSAAPLTLHEVGSLPEANVFVVKQATAAIICVPYGYPDELRAELFEALKALDPSLGSCRDGYAFFVGYGLFNIGDLLGPGLDELSKYNVWIDFQPDSITICSGGVSHIDYYCAQYW